MEWASANVVDQVNAGSLLIQTIGRVELPPNTWEKHNAVPIKYSIRGDAFLWTHAVAVSDQPFRTRLEMRWGGGGYLDNDFVRSELFWGDSLGTALKLPPKFFPLDADITIHAEDVSGKGGAVFLELVGYAADACGDPTDSECSDASCTCDRARFGKGRGLFVLSTPATEGIQALPTGEEATETLQTEDESHFRIVYFQASAHDRRGVQSSARSWQGNLTTTNARTGETLPFSNAKVIGAAWTGDALRPGRPPSPLVAKRKSDVSLAIESLARRGTNFIHMSFVGERLDDELLRENA